MFSGGGGGYDVANQFAGGGFMPTQADQGYGTGNQQTKSRNRDNQTLRAVTIRQLVQDIASADDDNLKVDGAELHNVTVVGKILSVQDSNMRLNIVISDGTGQAEVSHWLSGDEGDWQVSNKKAEWRPGVYIRAYGHVRSFDQKRSIQAFSLRTIHDHNEVTYHFLQCIFQHMHLTRGGAGKGALGVTSAGGGGFGGAAAGGWQPQQTGAGAAGGGAGMDPCEAAVMSILQEPNSQGHHVNDICNRLLGQFSRAQVEQTLNFLVTEARAYNVDDYHFQLT